MDIEEWKPPSPEPRKAPVPPASKTRQVIGYGLAGIGVFVVTLAVMARHEIGEYMAQRTAVTSEPHSATPVFASPLPAAPITHDAVVNAGNPAVPHQVNPTPPPHLAPRPFEKEKP